MIRRRRPLVRVAVFTSLSVALVLTFAASAARSDLIDPGPDETLPPQEVGSTDSATTTPPTDEPTASAVAVSKPLVLAHYYIWFNVTSWNRAKTDYPLVGKYSSDQATVMRTQVRQAKAAGIDGFIVSWKSSDELNRRLEQLVSIADDENFKLAITYQALDFNRNPLPVARIGSDLDWLRDRYRDDPAFKLMGDRPLVVWTGTWSYSIEDIATVTEPRRDSLRILASAKNVTDYTRVAPHVDGNLYYWSSVDPTTNDNHETKLTDMANVVRASGGLWIAPAAPGFDARLVGGKSVVDRRDGQTLREEWNAALATLPDAIGIISWNEFSENTYIEPSHQYGSVYLDVVRSLTGAPGSTTDFDSDAPTGRRDGPWNLIIIGVFILFTVGCAVLAIRRTRHVPRHIRRSHPDGSYYALMRTTAALVLVPVLVLVAAAGCGGGAAPRPTAATRPVTKVTCPSPIMPTDAGFELVNRNLVGYGPTTLGVEESYTSDGASLEIVSGGYFDEITEPYDTVQPVGTVPVRGADAEVLAGPYQDAIVHIALWREPGIDVPCDAHAIVATGVTEQRFLSMLATLG